MAHKIRTSLICGREAKLGHEPTLRFEMSQEQFGHHIPDHSHNCYQRLHPHLHFQLLHFAPQDHPCYVLLVHFPPHGPLTHYQILSEVKLLGKSISKLKKQNYAEIMHSSPEVNNRDHAKLSRKCLWWLKKACEHYVHKK